MRISQYDYEEFYEYIMEELDRLEGKPEPSFSDQRSDDCSDRNLCIEADCDWTAQELAIAARKPTSFLEIPDPPIPSGDDIISLSEYEYGEYIDSLYKDEFIAHCKKTESFDVEYFVKLAKRAAERICKKREDEKYTQRVMDEMREALAKFYITKKK